MPISPSIFFCGWGDRGPVPLTDGMGGPWSDWSASGLRSSSVVRQKHVTCIYADLCRPTIRDRHGPKHPACDWPRPGQVRSQVRIGLHQVMRWHRQDFRWRRQVDTQKFIQCHFLRCCKSILATNSIGYSSTRCSHFRIYVADICRRQSRRNSEGKSRTQAGRPASESVGRVVPQVPELDVAWNSNWKYNFGDFNSILWPLNAQLKNTNNTCMFLCTARRSTYKIHSAIAFILFYFIIQETNS